MKWLLFIRADFLTDFLSFLKSIYLLYLAVGAILGFFGWIISWTQDAKNEKFFKKIFKETTEINLIRNFKHDEPPGVIYYKHTPISLFRRELKKLYYKIRRINVEKGIIAYDTKEDMIYKVILDAFSYLPGLRIVDEEFAKSLVYFLAYQYIYSKKIPPAVKNRFKNNFEKSKFYDMVKCFGDKEYCDENIVLNPSSEMTQLRGLITEIVLPLMRFSSKRLEEERANIPEVEKKKESLMDLFNSLYRGQYFVLYVGRLPTQRYITLLKEKIEGGARGFVIGASANFYSKMSTIITFINPILVEKWGEKWVYVDDEEGFDEERNTTYHYIILRRCREPRYGLSDVTQRV